MQENEKKTILKKNCHEIKIKDIEQNEKTKTIQKTKKKTKKKLKNKIQKRQYKKKDNTNIFFITSLEFET